MLKRMNNEQVRIGYIWLAKDTGVIKKKLVEMTNRLTIEKAIDKISGVSIRVKSLTEKEFSSQYPDFKEKKSLLQEAADIFGGKIV